MRNVEIRRQFTKLDRNKVKVESRCARCRDNVGIIYIIRYRLDIIYFRKIFIFFFTQKNNLLARETEEKNFTRTNFLVIDLLREI